MRAGNIASPILKKITMQRVFHPKATNYRTEKPDYRDRLIKTVQCHTWTFIIAALLIWWIFLFKTWCNREPPSEQYHFENTNSQ